MRFAAVTTPKAEPQRSPAAEFVRRLIGPAEKLVADPAQGRPAEPPPDLDQRVRLIGEW